MAQPSESAANSGACEGYQDIKWDQIEFGIVPTDLMYIMKCSEGEKFCDGSLIPYGKIELSPSAGILNYGQGIFEGLKAYRTEDGRIVLFRPEENARRMKIGAERMCMPSPTIDQFVNAIKQIVIANKRWVPSVGKGSLYIRPLLMGIGSVLGLTPTTEYTFLIFTTPVVKSYHKGPLNLVVKDGLYRAVSGCGGTGGIKSITNYSPGNAISTPKAEGTILPGITRKSIIDIAVDLGYEVEERAIPVEELLLGDEVFCSGTAVVVNPVFSVTYNNTKVKYKTGSGTVSEKMYETLVGIQTGHIDDTKGWTLQIN